MQTSSFDPQARTVAPNTIGGYKQYISPIKGFSCRHRLLHGESSSSDDVKRAFTEQSLVSAVQSSVQRLRDCTAASLALKAAQTTGGFRCIIIFCCLPI